MSTEVYRFKVGTFDCMAVSDGTFTYAPPLFPPLATLLFANAPSEGLEQVLREYKLQPSVLLLFVLNPFQGLQATI